MGGGLIAQNTRCYNPEFVGNTADEPRKCESIDPNAKKTIIIDDKLGNPALLSNLGNGSYAYTNFIVNTDLVLDKQSSFYNCKFLVKEGVQITISEGKRAEFAFCYLYACEKMWKGIAVGTNSTLGFYYNRIEDAQYAILAKSISNLSISNNEFRRNYIGVYLKATPEQPGIDVEKFTPKLLNFAKNTFESSADGTRLNYPYDGQLPTPTIYNTFAGLRVEDMSLVLPSRDQNSQNNFMRICIGILLRNATVDIAKNCRFEEIVFDGNKDQNNVGDYHNDDDTYPLGVAIYANNTKLTFEGLGNKGGINKTATIKNFARAGFYTIESSLTVSQLHLLINIDSGKLKFKQAKLVFGIYAEGLKSLDVNYSTLQNDFLGENEGYYYYGVYSPSSLYATKINVQNTDFSSPVLGDGIHVQGYKGNSPLLIRDCTFNKSLTEQLYKKGGVFLSYCNFPYVIDNHFYWRTVGDAITIDNCKKTFGVIDKNYIMGDDDKSSIFAVRGIVINQSNNMNICGNELDSIRTGVMFIGNCTGTNFGENDFHHHTIALSIGESQKGITTTIDPQDRKDNTWIKGQSYYLDGINHFSPLTNRFFIEKGVNDYPLFPKLLNPLNAKWFVNSDSSYPVGCVSSEPPRITPFTDGVLEEEWYETYNDVEKWEALRHVYRGIYEGTYGNTDTRLSVFYLQQYNTSVGKIERVHILMDDAYRMSSSSLAAMESLKNDERAVIDMMVALMVAQANKGDWDAEALGKYELYLSKLDKVQVQIRSIENEIHVKRLGIMQNAQELNNGITANTDYEKDELRLNQIEIKMIIENRDLTDAEINEVEVIAHKCNKAFGANVSRAYYMLPLCVSTDFNIGCDGEIGIFDEPISGKKMANKQAEVYPNPVNDVLICNHMSLVAQVKMVNGQGQVVRILNLEKGTQSFEIDVKSLPTGIYSLVLQNFDSSTAIQKIVVQH